MRKNAARMLRNCLGLSLMLLLLLPACSSTLGETRQEATMPSYSFDTLSTETEVDECAIEKEEVSTLKSRVESLKFDLEMIRPEVKRAQKREATEDKLRKIERKLSPFQKRLDALKEQVSKYEFAVDLAEKYVEVDHEALIVDRARMACRFTPKRVRKKWLDGICHAKKPTPRWEVIAEVFYSELTLLEALKKKRQLDVKLAQAKITFQQKTIAYSEAKRRLATELKVKVYVEVDIKWAKRGVASAKKAIAKAKVKLAKFLKKYESEFKPLQKLAEPLKRLHKAMDKEKPPPRHLRVQVKRALAKFKRHRKKPLDPTDLSLFSL